MELKSALLVCVVISVANLLDARSINETDPQMKEHKIKYLSNRNLVRTEGLKCEPKIRLVYMSDHPDAKPDNVYDPLAAVIHLCDSTCSYCDKGDRYRCKPTEEEEVEIVFNARPSFGKGKPSFKAFNFTSHTQCACM